jgi:hypothetical protein
MYDGDGQRVQTVAYVMGIPLRALPRPPTASTGAAAIRCWLTAAAASGLSFMGCLPSAKLVSAIGTTIWAMPNSASANSLMKTAIWP